MDGRAMQETWYRRPAFKRVGPRVLSNPANDDTWTAEMNLYEKEVVAADNSLSLPETVCIKCIGEDDCTLECVVQTTILQLEKMGIDVPSGES